MDFHVSLTGAGDLAARIYRALRDAVLDGRLAAGEKVPPTRDLAQQLAVSRTTVSAAYDRLTAEGFLVGKVGAGTFVCEKIPGRPTDRRRPGAGARPRQVWVDLVPERKPPRQARFDFTVGIPDVELFPFETWRRLMASELRRSVARQAQYGEPNGVPSLRAAIARHIGRARSVRADAEDVLVTQGAQQALDIIGRVLIEPGLRVAVEDPGYEPARLLFRSLGARIVPVPVERDGIVVDAIPDDVGLVYTTPSHQFPLGVPMSLSRRAALLDWVERHESVVIEDDYDSEFRYADRPLEPLQSLDPHGRVVYVGSFSKTLLPMLRLGFVIAPRSLSPALRAARSLSDWHGDLATQAALGRFIDEGLLARHVRKASQVYAARQAALLSGIRGRLTPWLTAIPSAAGLHVSALLTDPSVSVDLLLAEALDRQVLVEDLARWRIRPGQAGLTFGFGAVVEADIGGGLERLAEAFRAVAPRQITRV